MDIGRQLRNLLEQDHISQRELAEELNISATTLNGYIQNRREPDAKMIARFANYFRTSTDYIYGISKVREQAVAPLSQEEQQLINLYRAMPAEYRRLYLDTGKTFYRTTKKNRS